MAKSLSTSQLIVKMEYKDHEEYDDDHCFILFDLFQEFIM